MFGSNAINYRNQIVIFKYMSFLFLSFFITISHTTTYSFNSAIIDIFSYTATASVNTLQATDQCSRLVARNTGIYHLSSENKYQSWAKQILGTNRALQQIPYQTVDFDVNPEQTFALIPTTTLLMGGYVLPINQSLGTLISQVYNQTQIPTAASIKGIDIVDFSVGTASSVIKKFNTSGLVQSLKSATKNYIHMAVTPDHKKAIIWDITTSFQVVSLVDMETTFDSRAMTASPTADITQKITFSKDSSLAIIETDNINPLLIYSMTSYNIVHQIPISAQIYSAHFLDSSNELIAIFTNISFIIVNLTTLDQFHMDKFNSTIFATDGLGNIFTCNNNIIKQYLVTFTPIIDETQFYVPLQFTAAEQMTINAVNDSLIVTADATTTISNVVASIPFTVYFLGFLNYFVFCSIYVLLNFQIPKHIYMYLSPLYKQVNDNFFGFLGVSISLDSISTQKVTSSRGLFFGVSTDVLPANLVAFFFLIANIAFVVIMQLLFTKIRKNNFFKKLFDSQKCDLIYGQITNVLMPLTLPWTFVLLEAGVRDFKTKLNCAAYLVLFFVALVFPIYFFFQALQQKEEEILTQRRKEQKKKLKEKQERQRKAISNETNNNLSQGVRESSGKITLAVNIFPPTSQKNQTNRNIFESSEIKSQSLTQREAQSVKAEDLGPTERANCNKNELNDNKQFIKRETSQKYTNHHKIRTVKKREQLPKINIQFSQLITIEVVQSWYLCQANFIYPCLALLSSPAIFLVIIFFYSSLGVIIAFKKKQMRVNSFILSLYPFLFHICFMIFFWGKDNKLLVLTEISCLAIFSLGSMHHCLTLIYELIMFLIKMIKQLCKSSGNKIKPSDKKNDQISEQLQGQITFTKEKSLHKKENQKESVRSVQERPSFMEPISSNPLSPKSNKIKIKTGGSKSLGKNLIIQQKSPWRY